MAARRQTPGSPGPLARELLEAVLGRGGLPSHGRLARAFSVEADAVQDACVRLLEKVRLPAGRAALEDLLSHRNDGQLAAYLRRVMHNAAMEAAPEYPYYRALRNHVTALTDPSLLYAPEVLCEPEPAKLEVDGRIQREAVAAALAVLLADPWFAYLRHQLASPDSRSAAISEATRILVSRYPPEGAVLDAHRAPERGMGEWAGPAAAHDPTETESALRRKIDARLRAKRFARILGPDLPLVRLKLTGKTLEQIAMKTGIPRATVADRLERAYGRLSRQQRSVYYSLGTAAEAIGLLLANRWVHGHHGPDPIATPKSGSAARKVAVRRPSKSARKSIE